MTKLAAKESTCQVSALCLDNIGNRKRAGKIKGNERNKPSKRREKPQRKSILQKKNGTVCWKGKDGKRHVQVELNADGNALAVGDEVRVSQLNRDPTKKPAHARRCVKPAVFSRSLHEIAERAQSRPLFLRSALWSRAMRTTWLLFAFSCV